MTIQILLRRKHRVRKVQKSTGYIARTGNRHGPKDPKILREKRWNWVPPTLAKQAAARGRHKNDN